MANISQVYLLDTPLEDDLKHTLYFANKTAQHTYMSNNVVKSYVNVSYQRDTSTFRCPAHIDTIRQCNYMMYQNSAYSNKWFYCFIEKMTYISDGLTDVEFKVDPIQTFMFDFDTQPSFIEREHTNDDTRGSNTVPENFELGEYIKNSNVGTQQWNAGSTMVYVVGVSEIVGSLTTKPSSNINGVPNGLFYLVVDSVSDLHGLAEVYDLYGKASSLYTMFICPKSIFWYGGGYALTSSRLDYDHNNQSGFINLQVPTDNSNIGDIGSSYTTPFPTRIGMTYTPRNKKLLTYPFCFFNISNNAGTSVTYRYEDFSSTPNFKMEGIVNIGCSIKLYPTNYKNLDILSGGQVDNPYDYGINMAKFPTISWNSDSYTNWITQNSIDIAMKGVSAIGGIGATIGGIATGNPLLTTGGVTTALNSITDVVKQNHQAQLIPNQVEGNINVGDLNYSKNKNAFTVFPMSIKPEFAKIIDDYFDAFGYACHRIKKPNYAHRENWWYTKTIDIYIRGNIPNEYMNEIKNAYNNGITYWRNPSNFMNYSVSNGIVS